MARRQQLLHDPHLPGIEVQVSPEQAAQFALAGAGVQRQRVEGRRLGTRRHGGV